MGVDFNQVAEESRASIEKEDLKVLLPIIANINPAIVLEVGMHRGYSMQVWRNAFPQIHLIGIEKDPPTQDSYLEPYAIWNKDSHEGIGYTERNIDFLFIDGDHSEEGVRKDFEIYSPLVKKGGIIALHDVVYTSPDPLSPVMVKPLWDELKLQYPFVEIKVGKNSTGIGVLFV